MEWEVKQIKMGTEPGNRDVTRNDAFVWGKETTVAETIDELHRYETDLCKKIFMHFLRQKLVPENAHRMRLEGTVLQLNAKKTNIYIDDLIIGTIYVDFSFKEGARVSMNFIITKPK